MPTAGGEWVRELVGQEQGVRYPAIMANFGVDVWRYGAGAMARLQRRLEGGPES